MGILEKMQNWDTWEDIVKDSDPFLNCISTKLYNGDFSFLDEVDDLKKVVARLMDEFLKVFEEGRPAREALVTAVKEMTELYKMIEDWDKFENLLKSDTALNELEKSLIVLEWGEHRATGLKVVKSLGSETIEECLKRKSVEVSEARPKANLLEPRMDMMSKFVEHAEEIQRWTELYTDAYGFSPPPSLSPSPSPSSSPTNTRVRDNIGSSSSPTKKRVKHNIGSTSSVDKSFVLPY